MQLTSIREFRSGLSAYTKAGQMVLVMNHGKMVGCFLPLVQPHDIPVELKTEFVTYLGKQIASSLASKKISEKEILDDFRKFKKTRNR